MYIKKVTIENIRSISHFEMDFPEPAGWHVLIGDNGSGKTTALRAIAACLLRDRNTIYPFWQVWPRNSTSNGGMAINIAKCNDDEGTKISFQKSMRFTRKHLLNWKYTDNTEEGDGWFSMSFGAKRSFSAEDKDSPSPFANAHLSLLDEKYTFSKITNWLITLELDSSKNQNGNLAYVKSILNQGLLPNRTTFEGVKKVGNRGEYKAIFKKDREEFSIDDLSDGYRSILILILEILRQMSYFFADDDTIFRNIKKGEMNIPVSGVILIDEIDAHLHPSWQTRIGQWFTKYFPNIQFIVTTHSPLVCRACEKGSIWRLAAPGSGQESGEITGIEKDRLVFGNILDAYGTEVFGESPVRSEKSNEKLKRLGKLDMLAAFGKISEEEENERKELQKIFQTDVAID